MMAAHADLTEEEVWAMEEEDDFNDDSRSSASSEHSMDKDILHEEGMDDDFIPLGQNDVNDNSLLASSLPIAVPQLFSNSIPSRSGFNALERPTNPTMASNLDGRPAAFLPRIQSPDSPSGRERGIFVSHSYQPAPFGGSRVRFSPKTEGFDDFVPPHMLSSQSRGMSSSVAGPGDRPRFAQLSSTCPQHSYLQESVVGRPGKGRDAIKIRNAIFKQTGFTAM
eukprot:8603126-Pyramimonas_sp.AAC.1